MVSNALFKDFLLGDKINIFQVNAKLMLFNILGDATLVFEIELFEFHGEDVTKENDGGVVKRIKVNGEGWDMPNDGAQVEIDMKATTDGKVFDERNVKFELGEGAESNIPLGLEVAIEKMKVKQLYSFYTNYIIQF